MKKQYRIVFWGPGHVGGTALKEALRRPEFDVVGVLVFNPDKDGIDIGTLVGLEPVGVKATTDKEVIFSVKADCVIHTPRPAMDRTEQDDDVIRLLELGKNVISVADYFYPPMRGSELTRRLEDACRKGGASLHGSGIHPSFMLERVVMTLTGLMTEIRHIRLVEATDCAHMLSPIALEIVGWGKDPADLGVTTPGAIIPDRMYREAICFLANRLYNVQPSEVTIEANYNCIVADAPYKTAHHTIAKGKALTITHNHKAFINGHHFFTNEEYWYLGRENCPFKGFEGGSSYIIEIDGKPASIKFCGDVASTMTDDPNTPVTTHITAVPLLQAVSVVCTANPGIVYHKAAPHFASDFRDTMK